MKIGRVERNAVQSSGWAVQDEDLGWPVVGDDLVMVAFYVGVADGDAPDASGQDLHLHFGSGWSSMSRNIFGWAGSNREAGNRRLVQDQAADASAPRSSAALLSSLAISANASRNPSSSGSPSPIYGHDLLA